MCTVSLARRPAADPVLSVGWSGHQFSAVERREIKNMVFAIGHSTHTQEDFIELLERHRITAVCDVRSKPYSRMNPQFNREDLTKALASHGIEYRFLGKELGARSEDPSCYEGDKVRYSKLANTQLFKDGLKRVRRGLKEGFRIALMCAEKEPLECHRTILVAPQLIALGIAVSTSSDGHLEPHDDASIGWRVCSTCMRTTCSPHKKRN